MKRLANLKDRLYQHYSAPLTDSFAQFKLGSMLFFFGLVLVYMTQQLLDDSLRQEIIAAVGLAIAALGFLVAMSAHVRMLISRLLHFFKRH
ncbi:hypothetical protein R50072_24630 [Simiduia litorea]|uniref:hypothetical protein n=1 Tax=Simiduia litorea TaxID=1435348 RepID=UPI0036F4206A